MTLDRAITNFRRKTAVDYESGYLGDGNGVVRDAENGMYYVRVQKSTGNLAPPVKLPLVPGQSIPPRNNLVVRVGYDNSGQRIILGVDPGIALRQNTNPLTTNPSDPSSTGLLFVAQMYNLMCRKTPGIGLSAQVMPGWTQFGSTYVEFDGGTIDLSGDIPGAGNHLYSVVFLKSDGTLESATSTAQSTATPLDNTDIQEAIDAATVGSLPLKAWVLENGDAELDDTLDTGAIDLRPLFSPPPTAAGVKVRNIPVSTYDSLQDYIDIFSNAGYVSGGALTDNGDGTIDIAAGTGLIRSSDSDTAAIYLFDWPATAGISLVDDATNFIVVSYNAGAPNVTSTTSEAVLENENDQFELYNIVRDGTTLHLSEHKQLAGNAINYIHQWQHSVSHIWRGAAEGGLILGETGTRNVTLTAGVLWAKFNRADITAKDTSSGDTFDRYYRDGVGGWTKQTGQTQWDNDFYDDGTGVLNSTSPNRFSVQYFYIDIDDELVSMYGQAEYVTLAGAETDSPPSSVPERISEHALLVGRIIFQYNDATAQLIESAFDVTFNTTGTSDHNNLGSLQGGTTNEYYHLTSAQHTDLVNISEDAEHLIMAGL